MKPKGQLTMIGLLFLFITIVVFSALSPTINQMVSTYSYFGTSDKLMVELIPTILVAAILVSIVSYVYVGRQPQQ